MVVGEDIPILEGTHYTGKMLVGNFNGKPGRELAL
jgi:hypothetical protein